MFMTKVVENCIFYNIANICLGRRADPKGVITKNNDFVGHFYKMAARSWYDKS